MGLARERNQERYCTTQVGCVKIYQTRRQQRGEDIDFNQAANKWKDEGRAVAFKRAYEIYWREGLNRTDVEGLYKLTKELSNKREERKGKVLELRRRKATAA